MTIIIYNTVWMAWNTLLALLSVMLGWFLIKEKKRIMRLLLTIVWLFFVPNTIYIITDVYHLVEQWAMVYGIEKLFVIGQYFFFISVGIVTFVISLYFFEYALTRLFKQKISESVTISIITLVNFIIAFGVIVGRVQRTNSWQILTHPMRVYNDIIQTFSSPLLLVAVFVFGVLGNIIYFSIRDIYGKPLNSFRKFLSYTHR